MGNPGLCHASRDCGRVLPWAVALLVVMLGGALNQRPAIAQTTAAPKVPPLVGTIKTIAGNSLTLTTDAGLEWKVQLPPDVKLLRVPPGSRDLKDATAIPLSSLQPGDRILVRGKPGDEAATFLAATVVAMKREDIAEKQAREREEWQQHGIGGLVKSVDTANSTITISRLSATGVRDVLIHAPTGTIVRRYAPGSVRFDEARLASLTEIRAGDQMRARGARSADGNEFTADEVVSGSFRNVAGPILAVNAASGTLTVTDLATKKPVELKVTADSQMRKLPQPVAQRIALRLKGAGGEANGGGATVGQAAQAAGTPASAAAPGTGGTANGSAGGAGRSGAGDIQQMLSRLPVSPLTDFQKGDAVMVVATPAPGDAQATVITLLGGVEPILQGTSQGQAASLLSPWSLSEGGSGDAGTP